MVYIAKFIRPLFYFWIFGCISILLDLDHFIQVYRDGLEFNLENLAYHGTRTLHIPILILSGCLCFVTIALFLRFRYLNPSFVDGPVPKRSDSYNNPDYRAKTNLIIKMATNAVFPGHSTTSRAAAMLVECPQCNEYIGVIPTASHTEFPCPYCGIEGYLDSR